MRLTQRFSPIDKNESDNYDFSSNFHIISSNYNHVYFNGLALVKYPNCLPALVSSFIGNDKWGYAFGIVSKSTCCYSWQGEGIPIENNIVAYIIKLWIRMHQHLTCLNPKTSRINFILFEIMLLLK